MTPEAAQPSDETGDALPKSPRRLSRRHNPVLYPNHYAWYVLAATLDVICTHQILHRFKGSEMNKLADALIQRCGLLGMIGLKYSSIVLVVLICEFVGRRQLQLGRRLAVAAICISALPVGIGLLQLSAWTHMVSAGELVAAPHDDGDFEELDEDEDPS